MPSSLPLPSNSNEERRDCRDQSAVLLIHIGVRKADGELETWRRDGGYLPPTFRYREDGNQRIVLDSLGKTHIFKLMNLSLPCVAAVERHNLQHGMLTQQRTQLERFYTYTTTIEVEVGGCYQTWVEARLWPSAKR